MKLCRGCHEHLPATDGCLREACGMPCNRLGAVVAVVRGGRAPSESEPFALQQHRLASTSRDEPRQDTAPAPDPATQFVESAWEVPCVYSAAESGGPEGAQPEVVGEVRDGTEGCIAKARAKCQRAARKALCVLRQMVVRHLL